MFEHDFYTITLIKNPARFTTVNQNQYSISCDKVIKYLKDVKNVPHIIHFQYDFRNTLDLKHKQHFNNQLPTTEIYQDYRHNIRLKKVSNTLMTDTRLKYVCVISTSSEYYIFRQLHIFVIERAVAVIIQTKGVQFEPCLHFQLSSPYTFNKKLYI